MTQDRDQISPPSTAKILFEDQGENIYNHARTPVPCGVHASKEHCHRGRPVDEHSQPSHVFNELVGKSVTPFLREHIPGLYAPIGKPTNHPAIARTTNPNTKYCYRHQPDARCRRAADEAKMEVIQRKLDILPPGDRQAITHVWALFSAAPARVRELMLKGIITQCCFPQLSCVSLEVQEQLKIDFLSALPTEISYQILGMLDVASLCRAAQVSRRWRDLADDDVVWHRMCEQHIDRKCSKCGWGLPLLERKRLSEFSREINVNPVLLSASYTRTPPPQPDLRGSVVARKRSSSADLETRSVKRSRADGISNEITTVRTKTQLEIERKFKTWKNVYKDRFQIGYNWKHGRCSKKTFRGHSNGITCLQFNDRYLVTGSYDATVKVWDIESGEVVRTLRGHQTGIRSLCFEGSVLVSGSLDKTIKCWNWQTGDLLSTLPVHTEGVITVHMDGDYMVSGSIDHTIRVFRLSTKGIWVLRGHTDWVNHVRVDSRAQIVYSASDDCTVKIWDISTLQCIKTLEGHVGQVQQLLVMPEDFELEIEDSADNECSSNSASHRTRGSSNFITDQFDLRSCYGSLFSDPSRILPARYLLTAGLDNVVLLWDTATGQKLLSFFGHLEGIWGLAGDTLRAVTGANDGMVKVWDPRTGKCERTFTGHNGPVTCVGLSDSRMASGSDDGEVRLYSFDADLGPVEELGTYR